MYIMFDKTGVFELDIWNVGLDHLYMQELLFDMVSRREWLNS